MITSSDLIHPPCTRDLTQGGITYALRSLPYTYNRMGGSPCDCLRRIVAGVAVQLAFRWYLAEQNVPFDVKGATPFTEPDRYDVALGGSQVQGRTVGPLVAPEHRRAFAELLTRTFRGESGTLVFEMIGLKGRLRKLYGWAILVLSVIAFASVTVFEMKRLFVSEAGHQPLVNTVMLLMDFALGMLLVVLAMVLIWRLADLFKKPGRWTEESAQDDLSAEVG